MTHSKPQDLSAYLCSVILASLFTIHLLEGPYIVLGSSEGSDQTEQTCRLVYKYSQITLPHADWFSIAPKVHFDLQSTMFAPHEHSNQLPHSCHLIRSKKMLSYKGMD